MEYQTPGVYIREIDSGERPITSVATSIPGFLGLFKHDLSVDAVEVRGTNGENVVAGRLLPDFVDYQGRIPPHEVDEAVTALERAMQFKRSKVRDLKKLLELNGHKVEMKPFKSNTRIHIGDDTVDIHEQLLSIEGKIITEDESAVEELLNRVGAKFALDRPQPQTARDLLEVYGYEFQGAVASALLDAYSLPPFAVRNKSEFFRWLQSYYAEYLVANRSMVDLVGEEVEDPEEAADAVFEALAADSDLKQEFREWLSQPSVFNFVASVNGFYDNGGGKSYVYLMGVPDIDGSIRSNQLDKLGLYAFDDVDDMAIHVATGLSTQQQKEMLEHCEIRKDRFAILDGPLVSTGDMEIPSSDKGYGAIYVPWLKIKRPTWYTGDQVVKPEGPLRRSLIEADEKELYLPPSGHIAGVFARVDTTRGVHKSPANEVVEGITGLSQNINRIAQGRYNQRGINCIRIFRNRGIRVWGARTLATQSDPSWRYVNVRRLFIMIEQSIMTGSQWAVFESNDHMLWKRLTRDVRAYLLRVWRMGALTGSTADEAFYVKCDAETNPRHLIDAGQVNLQVGVCPVRPAEFVVFSIGQWDGGAMIEDLG